MSNFPLRQRAAVRLRNATLRYSINVTLDGCCDHRAIPPDEDLHRHAIENLAQADALLFGRVTYEMMEAAWRRYRTSRAATQRIAVNEHASQVGVPALADAQQQRSTSGGMLARHRPSHAAKSGPMRKAAPLPMAATMPVETSDLTPGIWAQTLAGLTSCVRTA
jgi:hypothetical protein